MSMNRIITRGFGPSRGVAGQAGPVTMGYAGIPRFVIDVFRRRYGSSGYKRRLKEFQFVTVWAKLLEINGKISPKKIQGFVNVPVSKAYASVLVEHVSSRVRQACEDVKITVKRLK